MSQLAKEVALPTTAELNAVISRQIPPAESPEQRRSDQRDSLFERFAWLYIFCRENLFRDDTNAGSAIGFVVGIVIAQAGTAGFRLWAHAPIYPVMHFSTGLLAAVSAITVGLIFGTYPARKAAELSPVEAIARE